MKIKCSLLGYGGYGHYKNMGAISVELSLNITYKQLHMDCVSEFKKFIITFSPEITENEMNDALLSLESAVEEIFCFTKKEGFKTSFDMYCGKEKYAAYIQLTKVPE
jgi:hypothetical protein